MLKTAAYYGPFFVLLLFSVCIPALGQKAIDGVVITGDVTNVVLCNQQDDTWIYRITIKLHAQNVGTEPVIVSGADGLTDFYKFANTLNDLQAKGYAHIGWVTSDPGDPKSVPSRLLKPFRVVAPNASVDINVEVRALVIGELKPGATYIQIVAENWPGYSDAYTDRIKVAWKSHGNLWAHSLHPEPIEFIMPSRVKRVRCP
jgi:hypothetical protein